MQPRKLLLGLLLAAGILCATGRPVGLDSDHGHNGRQLKQTGTFIDDIGITEKAYNGSSLVGNITEAIVACAGLDSAGANGVRDQISSALAPYDQMIASMEPELTGQFTDSVMEGIMSELYRYLEVAIGAVATTAQADYNCAQDVLKRLLMANSTGNGTNPYDPYNPYEWDPAMDAAKYLRKCLDIPETIDLLQALRDLNQPDFVQMALYSDDGQMLSELLGMLNLDVPADLQKVAKCIMYGDYVSPIIHDIAHGVRMCAGDMIDIGINVTETLVPEAFTLEENLWHGVLEDEDMKAEFLEGFLLEKLRVRKEGLGKCVLEEMYKPKPVDMATNAMYQCLSERQIEAPMNLWETMQGLADRIGMAFAMERGPGQVSEMQSIVGELSTSLGMPLPNDLAQCVISTVSEDGETPKDALEISLGGVSCDAWNSGGKAVFKRAVAAIALGGEQNAEYITARSFCAGENIGNITGMSSGSRGLKQVSASQSMISLTVWADAPSSLDSVNMMMQEGITDTLRAELPAKLTSLDAQVFPSSITFELHEQYDPAKDAAKYLRKCLEIPETMDLLQALRDLDQPDLVQNFEDEQVLTELLGMLNLDVPADLQKVAKCIMYGDYVSPIIHDIAHGVRVCAGDMIDIGFNVTETLVPEAFTLEENLWQGVMEDEDMKAEFLEEFLLEKLQVRKEGLGKCVLEEMYKPKPVDMATNAMYQCLSERQIEEPMNLWDAMQGLADRIGMAFAMERGPGQVSEMQSIVGELSTSLGMSLPNDLAQCVISTVSEVGETPEGALEMSLGGVTCDAWTSGGKAVFKRALAAIALGGEQNAEYISARVYSCDSTAGGYPEEDNNGRRRLKQVSATPPMEDWISITAWAEAPSSLDSVNMMMQEGIMDTLRAELPAKLTSLDAQAFPSSMTFELHEQYNPAKDAAKYLRKCLEIPETMDLLQALRDLDQPDFVQMALYSDDGQTLSELLGMLNLNVPADLQKVAKCIMYGDYVSPIIHDIAHGVRVCAGDMIDIGINVTETLVSEAFTLEENLWHGVMEDEDMKAEFLEEFLLEKLQVRKEGLGKCVLEEMYKPKPVDMATNAMYQCLSERQIEEPMNLWDAMQGLADRIGMAFAMERGPGQVSEMQSIVGELSTSLGMSLPNDLAQCLISTVSEVGETPEGALEMSLGGVTCDAWTSGGKAVFKRALAAIALGGEQNAEYISARAHSCDRTAGGYPEEDNNGRRRLKQVSATPIMEDGISITAWAEAPSSLDSVNMMMQEGIMDTLRAELPAKLTSLDAQAFPLSMTFELHEQYNPYKDAAKYLRKCLEIPETMDLLQALRDLDQPDFVQMALYSDDGQTLSELLGMLNLNVPADLQKVAKCIMYGDYVSPIIHDIAHGVRVCAGDMIDIGINVTETLVSEAFTLEENLWHGVMEDEDMKAEFLEEFLLEKLQVRKEGLGKCVLEEMYKPKPVDMATNAMYQCLNERQIEEPMNLWETMQGLADRIGMAFAMERGPGQVSEIQSIVGELSTSLGMSLPNDLAQCVISTVSEVGETPEGALEMSLGGVTCDAWTSGGKAVFKRALAAIALGGEQNAEYISAREHSCVRTAGGYPEEDNNGRRRLKQVSETPPMEDGISITAWAEAPSSLDSVNMMMQEGIMDTLRAELPAKLTSLDAQAFPLSMTFELHEQYNPYKDAAKYLRKCLEIPETMDLLQALRDLDQPDFVQMALYSDDGQTLSELLGMLNLNVPADLQKVAKCIMYGDYVSPIIHDIAHGVRVCAGDMIDIGINVTETLVSEAFTLEENLWHGVMEDEDMKAEFLEEFLLEKLQVRKEGLGKCVLEEMYKPKPVDMATSAMYVCLTERQIEEPMNLWETMQGLADRIGMAFAMERGPGQVSEMQSIVGELSTSLGMSLPNDLAQCVISTVSEVGETPEGALEMSLGGVTCDAWTSGGKAVFKRALAAIALGGEQNAEYISAREHSCVRTAGGYPEEDNNGRRRLKQMSATPPMADWISITAWADAPSSLDSVNMMMQEGIMDTLRAELPAKLTSLDAQVFPLSMTFELHEQYNPYKDGARFLRKCLEIPETLDLLQALRDLDQPDLLQSALYSDDGQMLSELLGMLNLDVPADLQKVAKCIMYGDYVSPIIQDIAHGVRVCAGDMIDIGINVTETLVPEAFTLEENLWHGEMEDEDTAEFLEGFLLEKLQITKEGLGKCVLEEMYKPKPVDMANGAMYQCLSERQMEEPMNLWDAMDRLSDRIPAAFVMERGPGQVSEVQSIVGELGFQSIPDDFARCLISTVSEYTGPPDDAMNIGMSRVNMRDWTEGGKSMFKKAVAKLVLGNEEHHWYVNAMAYIEGEDMRSDGQDPDMPVRSDGQDQGMPVRRLLQQAQVAGRMSVLFWVDIPPELEQSNRLTETGIKGLLQTELPLLLNSLDADIFPSDMVVEVQDTMWYAINIITGCAELPQDYDLEQVLGAYTQQLDEIGAEEDDSAQSALVKALLEQIQLPAAGGITDELMECIMADPDDSTKAPEVGGEGRPETGDPDDSTEAPEVGGEDRPETGDPDEDEDLIGEPEGTDGDDDDDLCDLLVEAAASGNYEEICDLGCAGETGIALGVDGCKLSCEEMAYSMSVAIDIGLLTPEKVQQMCINEYNFLGLSGEVMAFSCEGAQDDSCCISAGTNDELFRPADEDTCNSLDGCGLMEVCKAKPMSEILPEPLTSDLADQDFGLLMDVCSSLGGKNRGQCRAIKWRGESLCETVPVCSKEEDEGEDFCSRIAEDVATCVDGSAEGSEEIIGCLMGLCTGDDDRCYNTVAGISAQVESGWSLDDIDVSSAVKAFCRWSSLARVLDEVLDEDCDDDQDSCDWNVPRALIPENPFKRRTCTGSDQCCIGDWQMGPEMCEDTAGCTFRGNPATGSCNVDTSCSACSECIAAISSLPPGTSAAGYLAACEESNRADGDDSYYCGVLEDWEEWLTRTAVGGRPPNYKAACYRLGFCKGASCLGNSLCPAEDETISPVVIQDGYCSTRQDCPGEDDRCLPFDDTDPTQQCVEQFTCDDDSGFFYARCLGTCVSKSEAACAIFRQSRVDGLMDLLYKYRSADAEGIEVEFEIAVSGTLDEAAEQAAEEAMVNRIEQFATDLETTVCYSPDDCTAGETCQFDQGCNIFNKICTDTGVIDSDPTVVCLGFCTNTGPVTLLGQDILAQFTADGQYISVELPSDILLDEVTLPAARVFEEPESVLGERGYVTGEGNKLKVWVGKREKFNLDEELSLTVRPEFRFSTRSNREVVFDLDSRVVSLVWNPERAQPKLPALRYASKWGKSCKATTANAGNGVITVEYESGELLADLTWSLVSVASDADVAESEAAVQAYLDIKNQEDLESKLSLKEAELLEKTNLSELAPATYILEVTVFNLVGESATTTVEFEKSGVAIPTIEFGAKTISFQKSRGIYLNPIKGSLDCPGSYSYQWTVVAETSPLVLPTTDRPFLRISPEQLAFGATYELQLAVVGSAGETLSAQSVILVVEAAELDLFVEALSSYRNNEDFELEAVLVDPDQSAEVAEYTWSCTPSAGGLCFDGTALPEASAGKYLVPASSLVLGTYNFMVKVTKGTRTAEEKVQVTIVDGTNYPPVGFVKVVCTGDMCKYDKPVSANEPLRLEAVVDGDVSQVSFDWSISEGLLESGTENGFNGEFLIVKPEALVPGANNKFSVRLTNNTSEASSDASLEVMVNQSPECSRTEGCVSVSPSEGFAYGDTEFFVEAAGWQDIDVVSGTQAIKYRFGYCVDGRCINKAFQESTSYSFKSLPPGDADTNKITIRVCAVDVYATSLTDLPLSETCQSTDIIVKPSVTVADIGEITQTLVLAKTASTEDQLETASTVVSIVTSKDAGAEATEAQKEEVREAISQAVDVVGTALESGDVPREVIEQIADTLTAAGNNTAADKKTRRKGIDILAKAANALKDASNGDSSAVKALGNNLLAGVGSMLNGFSGDEGDDDNENEDEDAGLVQQNLQQVTTEIAKNYLASVTPDDPFETLGTLITALTMGLRNRDQMSGEVSVSPQATITSRRRNMLVVETTPKISIGDEFGAACEAAGPFRCPSPVEMSISYFADSSYLTNGLGSRAFSTAVASYETADFQNAPIKAELVTGVLTVSMPNKNGLDLGSNMDVTMPIDADMYDPSKTLYCAIMDYLTYEPVVIGEVSSEADGTVCRCSATLLGEYFCIQANTTNPSVPPVGPAVPSTTPPAAPSPSPSPPATTTPPTPPAPTEWQADEAPAGASLVSSSAKWALSFDTVDKAQLADDVKAELASKLKVRSTKIHITSIVDGSVIVNYSVEVSSKADADEVLAKIQSEGTSLFSGLGDTYGQPVEVGSASTTGSVFEDGGEDGGLPIPIIAGAAAGGVVLIVAVAIFIYFMSRKGANVRVANQHENVLPGAQSQPMVVKPTLGRNFSNC